MTTPLDETKLHNSIEMEILSEITPSSSSTSGPNEQCQLLRKKALDSLAKSQEALEKSHRLKKMLENLASSTSLSGKISEKSEVKSNIIGSDQHTEFLQTEKEIQNPNKIDKRIQNVVKNQSYKTNLT